MKTGRKNPKKMKQILDGAQEVFLELGYGSTSVDAIARRAGVSKGTLYTYFPDKDALFAAVVEYTASEEMDVMFRVVDVDAEKENDLYALVHRFLSFLTSPSTRALYRMVVAESARFPNLGTLFYSSAPQTGRQRLIEYLRYKHECGVFYIEDPEEAEEVLSALIRGDLYHRALLQVSPDRLEPLSPEGVSAEALEAAVTKVVDLFMRLYGPSKKPSSHVIASRR